MMENEPFHVICIGGSAGSFRPVLHLLSGMNNLSQSIVLVCLHRGKHNTGNMSAILSKLSAKKIIEPDDKTFPQPAHIYLAPENYHLLVNASPPMLSLSCDEEVNFSRPSIDVLFETAAVAFKKKCIGILFSGANSDGALGLKKLVSCGGIGCVQDLNEAEIKTMPQAGKKAVPGAFQFTVNEMIVYINEKSARQA